MNHGNLYQRVVLLAVVITVSLITASFSPAYATDFNGQQIRMIGVKGNSSVQENSIREVLTVKPGETITTEKVKADMGNIYKLGYFSNVTFDCNEVPEGVQLVYTVTENPVFQELVIGGNTKVSGDKLSSMLTVTKGSVLNFTVLNNNVRAMEQYYHDQGYILAKVSNVTINPSGVLTLTINEGILEGVQIKGNDRTKEYVIRREMKLKPGEPFNVKDAKRSMQKVYNLGYFEDINMKLNPGREPNAVIFEMTVVEQRTGKFSVGGGYSSADGLSGMLGLGDDNFQGTGDKVKVNWEFGGNASSRNYEVGYTCPWIDDKQTSLGFTVYNMTNQYTDYNEDGSFRSTYDKKRKGFDITIGRPQGEYLQNYITIKQRDDQYKKWISGIDYTAPVGDPKYNSLYNQEYFKNNYGVTRSISLMRIYDSRDNVFDPKEGNRVALTAEVAGKVLGGDFNYNKYTAETRNYFPVGHAQVLALRGMVGYADGKIPDSGRFALGGPDTIRGYRDDQFKGEKMLAFSGEYRFPIAKKVTGVVFSDVGKAWSGGGYQLNDLAACIGVGLRIATPVGPIRLDYAKSSQMLKFHFSFGGQF